MTSPDSELRPAALSGKTALVTAASRGIGLAIARRLLQDGACVCLTARNAGPLQQAAASLGGSERVVTVPGSADDPQHQRTAVDRTIAAFGRLDILVNNAGINPVFGPLMEVDLAAARKTVEVNALAALGWSQQVYRAWMAANGGSIVNISSMVATVPANGIGLYGASKAMLNQLTRQLATEVGPRVRVNGVAPGIVKTDFAAALYDGKEDAVAAKFPLRRLGHPDDVAGAVAYLVSDDAGWVTGQTLVIDGGRTLELDL